MFLTLVGGISMAFKWGKKLFIKGPGYPFVKKEIKLESYFTYNSNRL